jgi:hypothetical protein
MINNTKVNRYVTKKNFPAALTISLLLILASNVTNTPLFELAYAIKEFNIDVDIEDNEIKRGDTQHITVTVSNEDTDNRVSDANVKLIVYPPDSDSTSAHDKTDNNGKATFDVEIDDNAETGTYDAEIRVSKDGYDTKSVNTSFDVVKSGGTDNEDDENEDYNGSSSSSSSSSAAASASAASSQNSDSDNGAASSTSSSNNRGGDGGSSSSSSSSSSAAAVGSAAAAAAASGGDASSAASAAVSENGGSSSAAAAAEAAAAAASASSSDNGDDGDSSAASAAASSSHEEDD